MTPRQGIVWALAFSLLWEGLCLTYESYVSGPSSHAELLGLVGAGLAGLAGLLVTGLSPGPRLGFLVCGAATTAAVALRPDVMVPLEIPHWLGAVVGALIAAMAVVHSSRRDRQRPASVLTAAAQTPGRMPADACGEHPSRIAG